jgi:peptide/nickel transport system substrate-binding protein
MKRFFLPLTLVLLLSLLIIGCSSAAPSTTAPITSAAPATSKPAVSTSPAPSAAATTSKPAPATTTAATSPAAAGQINKGGTMRIIRDTFATVTGYPPEMSPTDGMYALPYAERLVVWDASGNYIPELATSWDADPANNTLTWHLRQGVKFHDGTPFNADSVKNSFKILMDANRLQDGQFVKSIDVVDPYTVRMNLTTYTTMSIENYGWVTQYSPTALQSNGKEWARTHAVATGPFKLADFQRDNSIKYVKNPDYWRAGMPYLDSIEARYIPDPVTASAIMESKQADAWMDDNNVQSLNTLSQKGYKLNNGPGYFYALLPNSVDPKSPYSNPMVRQAVEYAIDRPSLANMVGLGKYEALTQLASSSWPGYVPGYNPRPYNVAKAKQLLADAGFPNGIDTKILASETTRDAATAIQGYLAAANIRAKVDVADSGRYFASVFTNGWTDLALARSGINPSMTDLFIHFGPSPMTYKPPIIAKSQQYLALCDQAQHSFDRTQYIAKVQAAVKQAGEDAMVVPLYRSAEASVLQPYVHSDYVKIHSIIWYVYQDWMDPH